MQATAEAVLAPATAGSTHTDERPGRGPALGLMAAGLAVLGLACALVATTPLGAPVPGAAPAPHVGAPAAASVSPDALTIQSAGDISVLNMTYEPGQSSGWHRHRGIHAVSVISGELTVYDQDCAPHTYGPGDAYIGGQLLHLVRNEGSEPATMVVTYFNPIGPAPAQVAPATPPCDMG